MKDSEGWTHSSAIDYAADVPVQYVCGTLIGRNVKVLTKEQHVNVSACVETVSAT